MQSIVKRLSLHRIKMKMLHKRLYGVLIQRYDTLNELAKKRHFSIHSRKSGKYTIIVAEPIHDKITLKQALYIIKKSFKHAYANTYTPSKSKHTVHPKKKIEATKENKKKLMPLNKKEAPSQNRVKVQPQEIKKVPITQKVMPKHIYTANKKEILNEQSKQNKKGVFQTISTFIDNFQWHYLLFLAFFIWILYYFKKMKKIYFES